MYYRCEPRMKWTWHHSKLAVEEVSFFGGLRVVLLQLLSIHDRAVGVTNLGVVLLWFKPNIHVPKCKYYCLHLVPKFGDVRDRQNWRLHPTVQWLCHFPHGLCVFFPLELHIILLIGRWRHQHGRHRGESAVNLWYDFNRSMLFFPRFSEYGMVQ